MAVVDWPDADDLKRLLDVDDESFEGDLSDLAAAAVEKVKADRGAWDEEEDEPDESLRAAAMRAAVLMRPNANDGLKALRTDEVYQGLMFGKRKRFSIG